MERAEPLHRHLADAPLEHVVAAMADITTTLAELVADRIFYTGHQVNASVSTIGRGANLYAFRDTRVLGDLDTTVHFVIGDLDTVHFVPDYFLKSSAELLDWIIADETRRSLELLIRACIPAAERHGEWATLEPLLKRTERRSLRRLAIELRAWLESAGRERPTPATPRTAR